MCFVLPDDNLGKMQISKEIGLRCSNSPVLPCLDFFGWFGPLDFLQDVGQIFRHRVGKAFNNLQ